METAPSSSCMVLHFEILWNLEFMSVVGKLFLLMFLPVFQAPVTDHLDQRVLGSRAWLGSFFLFCFFLFKNILEQTSPHSPSDILRQAWN